MSKKGFKYICYARKIYVYMNNILDKQKATRLHSISLARCFCFLRRKAFDHDDIFLSCCVCFSWKLRNLLRDILIECYDQKYFFCINVNNFNDDNDSAILNKMISVY